MNGKFFFILLFLVLNLSANKISKIQCEKKAESFIFAGQECIEYVFFEGEVSDKLNIIVHGTWEKGTNTLGRYAPFAENLAMTTDINTVAVALTGYSNSSTNNFPSLSNDKIKNLAAKKEYIEFLAQLIKALKKKYKANVITYIGHSAGCMMGATLSGLEPKLLNNLVCAGGIYDIHQKSNQKDLISAIDIIDNISKEIKIVLVYGTKDEISKPKLTKDFYDIAKSKGLNVKLVEIKDAVHIDLDMQDDTVDAIVELVEE